MGFAHQAGAAVSLVALTLWIQCAGMSVLLTGQGPLSSEEQIN
jgi:hypothetical protein